MGGRRRVTGTGRDILWHASLPALPLADRLSIAASAGFAGVSVSAQDLMPGPSGPDPEATVRRAADMAVRLRCLDSVIAWYPHETPKRMAEAAQQDVDALLALCERFAIPTVSALAMFPSTCDTDELAGCFARLCDRAAEHGLAVHLEFTPFPPITGLRGGWDLVQLAGRGNGGILLDTWHFFRSDADLDLVATAGHRVTAVQLSDGCPDFVESLLKDTFRHRRLPGEGSFDLTGLLEILSRTGGTNLVGPEVLSEDLWALPPEEAASRLAESAARVCPQ
jgi:sugar phosphate isomerase/epimerase